LKGVTKRYRRLEALCDVSLVVPKGQTLGLLGQNGAGKSTLLKLLMGLLRRDAGDVRVLGSDPLVDPLAVRRRVGYVPEQQFIYGWMRVREAAHFCRSFYPTWNDSLCDTLLTLFGLDSEKRVKELSKGMVVKLALVLALSHEPELLLLDEPMAGLDPIAREELLDGVLQTVSDRERTIVFSSHNFGDVQRLADTIAILHEGKLLVHAEVDVLLKSTKRIRAVLGNGASPTSMPDGLIWQRVSNREWLITVKDFSPDVVSHLRSSNQLEHVEVIDLGLEDIFKDYVRGWRESA